MGYTPTRIGFKEVTAKGADHIDLVARPLPGQRTRHGANDRIEHADVAALAIYRVDAERLAQEGIETFGRQDVYEMAGNGNRRDIRRHTCDYAVIGDYLFI